MDRIELKTDAETKSENESDRMTHSENEEQREKISDGRNNGKKGEVEEDQRDLLHCISEIKKSRCA